MGQINRHSQRSRRWQRLTVLPFVVLCAMAYLASASHFVLVQHATCPEHGEVIHVGEEGREHAQPLWVEDSFTDERITRVGQEASEAHGAEAHCAHTFLRREGLPVSGASLLIAEAKTEPELLPALEQLHPEPVARLRLAPKSSPPLS